MALENINDVPDAAASLDHDSVIITKPLSTPRGPYKTALNDLFGNFIVKPSTSTQTIAEPLSLAVSSSTRQNLNPGSAALPVVLPDSPTAGLSFILTHTGTVGVLVVFSGTTLVLVLSPNDTATVTYSDTWRVESSNRGYRALQTRDPYNVRARATSPTTTNIYWQRPIGAVSSGYSLERSTDGVNWTFLATVTPPNNCYGDSGLTANTTYQYRLTGSSGLTSTVTVTTLPGTVPAGNNGAAIGTVTYTTGEFGQAVVLSGSNGVTIPEPGGNTGPLAFQNGQSLTVEFWVKGPITTGYLLFHGDHTLSPPTGKGYKLYLLNTGEAGIDFNGIGATATAGAGLADGSWHHVAFVLQHAISVKAYVDGVLNATSVISGGIVPLGTENTSVIGHGYDSTTTGDNFVAAKIDELRVSDIARYTSAFTPPTAAFTGDGNTRLLYHFDNVLTDSATRAPVAHFVDPVDGSDSNDGLTPSAARRTVPAGFISITPGDAVLVKGGTTLAGLNINTGGTSALPVTLSSYSVGRATILPGNAADGVNVPNRGWVNIVSVEISGPGVNSVTGATTATGTYPGTGETPNTGVGIRFRSTLTAGSRLGDVRCFNCDVHGMLCGVTWETPFNHGGTVVGYSRMTFADGRVHNTQMYGLLCFGSAAIQGSTHANVEWTDNEVFDNGGCPNWTAAGTYGASVLPMNVTGGTVARNYVHDSGQAGGYIDNGGGNNGGTGGIILQEATNVLVTRNEVAFIHHGQGGDATGIDPDGGSNGCIVEYNYIHDTGTTGIQTGEFGGSSTTQNNVFRYNVVLRPGSEGGGGTGFYVFGGTQPTVHHNYFEGSATGAAAAVEHGIACKLLDNILVGAASQSIVYFGITNSGPIDGNLYWRAGGTFQAGYNGVVYTSLAAFKTASGAEPNGGTFSNPALLSAAGPAGPTVPDLPLNVLRHWEPQTGSPALTCGIDTGTLYGVPAGTTDFMLRATVSTVAGPVMGQ